MASKMTTSKNFELSDFLAPKVGSPFCIQGYLIQELTASLENKPTHPFSLGKSVSKLSQKDEELS